MTDYCTECQCHETDDQAGSGTTQTVSSVPSSITTSSSSENGTESLLDDIFHYP